MRLSITKRAEAKTGALVTGVTADRKLLKAAADLDKRCKGALQRAMAASRFKGNKGEILEVLAPAGLPNSRVILVGMGDPAKLRDVDLQSLGGALVGHLNRVGESAATVLVNAAAPSEDGAGPAERAAHYAYGALLGSYRFDRYRRPRRNGTSAT